MKPTIHTATIEDIGTVSAFHVKMFEEMLVKKGQVLSISTAETMRVNMTKKLASEIPAGTSRVWLIQQGAATVAMGGITLVSSVPTPFDTGTIIGYIHSMYTLPECRQKGHASSILNAIVSFAADRGIRRLTLNASDSGKKVYEKAGFRQVNEHMLKFLDA